MEDTPMPNIDMHRLIIRRKMTALKESLKNTEKLLDDAIFTLGSVALRTDDEDSEGDTDKSSKEKSASKEVKPEVQPNPERKWSVTALYF